MKKLSYVKSLFALFCAAFLFLANSTNPPNGRTGAPDITGGNEPFCAGCHSGNVNSFDGTIDITGIPSTVMGGTTYPVTVTISKTAGAPTRAGFQLTLLDDSAITAGTMTNAGANTTITTLTNRVYAEHQGALQFGANNSVAYSFDWTAPTSINGSNINLYSVTVMGNSNGNTSGDYSFTHYPTYAFVPAANPLSIQSSSTNVSCNGDNNGTATVTSSGGTGTYTYNWSNGANTATVSNLSAGTYTVTVVSGTESTTETVIITEPAPITISVMQQSTITCLNTNGSASVSATGGTGTLNYLWSTTETGQTANFLSAGNNTVSVTDGNNCLSVLNVIIQEDTNLPTATTTSNGTINCINQTVFLNGTGSSVGNNFSYSWTTNDGNILNGSTSLTPEVSAAGLYTLTVSDSNNGCQSSSNVQVSADVNTPTASVLSPPEITCSVATVNLNGSFSSQGAEFTYQWTAANGGTISGSTTNINATATTAGSYTLTVTNTNNGCQDTRTVNVTENTTAPIAEAGQSMVLDCINASVTLNGNDSDIGNQFNYTWTTNDGFILSGSNTPTPVVGSAGSYVLVVENTLNGCSSSDFVVVIEDTSVPTVSITPPLALDCNQSAIILDGSNSSQGNNLSYIWTTQTGNILGTANTLSTSNPGVYCLEITNNTNGCTALECVTVIQAINPTIVIDEVTDLECNGFATGFISIIANDGDGNYSYNWSNNATTPNIQQLDAGTYTVSVTDGNSCEATLSIVVEEPDALTLTITATGETTSNANDGTALASIGGGVGSYMYNWSNGETTQQISNLQPGSYQLTVTDENGCEIAGEVSINSFDCAFTADVTSTNVLCNGENTGTSTVATQNATMPVTYAWSSGGNAATETGLQAGSYVVTATDASNCQVVLTVSITEPTAITLTSTTSDVSCNGGNDGSAQIIATGGTAPYTYSWSNSGDGNNLAAGTYTVSVFDSSQCLEEITVVIIEPTALSVQMTSTEVSADGADDGTASAFASGGVSPYTYMWDDVNNSTTATISNLPVGTYCVTITDTNNCTFENCVSVNVSGCASLVATVTTTNVSCNSFNDASATVSAMGGSQSYTYAWSSGGNAQTETGLSAGTYTVSVTDSDNCMITETFTINQPTALTVLLVEINNIECDGQTSGSATVMGSGGTGNYSYAWSNGGDTGTQTNLAAGDYMVSVSDENTCETVFPVTIEAGNDATPPVALTQNIAVNLDANGNASINVGLINNGSFDNCGIGALTLSQTSFNCDDIGQNTVTLFVTDINGNADNATAIVTVIDNSPPVVSCPATYTVYCDGTVSYDFSASDNCDNISVTYTTGTESGSIFPIGQTDVSIIVTDNQNNFSDCSFTVEVTSIFMLTATVVNPTCNGGNDGSIQVETTGGSTPITLDIAGGTQGQLTAGSYLVTATDANGCSTSAQVVLENPAALEIEVTQVVNEQNNTANGAILIDIDGGTGNLTTSWTGPNSFTSTQEDLVNLVGGDYILTLTDGNGCSITETITVEQLTSVEQPTWAKNLSIYPNPAQDKVVVSLPSQTADVTFELLNIVGQVVQKTSAQGSANSSYTLYLNDIPTGIYWLKIKQEEEFIVEKLIVE